MATKRGNVPAQSWSGKSAVFLWRALWRPTAPASRTKSRRMAEESRTSVNLAARFQPIKSMVDYNIIATFVLPIAYCSIGSDMEGKLSVVNLRTDSVKYLMTFGKDIYIQMYVYVLAFGLPSLLSSKNNYNDWFEFLLCTSQNENSICIFYSV